MINNIGLPGVLLIAVFVLQVVCFFRIMGKAGFNAAWGIVAIIPLGAVVLILVLAFADWPKERGA
jgi:hypothetical protein